MDVQSMNVAARTETVALAASESIVFLGLRGDFAGDKELSLGSRLDAKKNLSIVGEPVRSFAIKDVRVWAVRTALSANKLERELRRDLKKTGYQVEVLSGTALSVLGKMQSAVLKRSLRDLERAEQKVWASHVNTRDGIIWVFHEPKFDSKDIQAQLRKSKVKTGFHHIELILEAQGELQADELAVQAKSALDLARASVNGSSLVLDIYLRDLAGMLALKRGKHNIVCPDVLAFLGNVPAGELDWTVTLDMTGFPFRD